MSDRNCLECVHCECDGGSPCESDPHAMATLRCRRGLMPSQGGEPWREGDLPNWDDKRESLAVLRGDLSTARTCPDYEPEEWANDDA